MKVEGGEREAEGRRQRKEGEKEEAEMVLLDLMEQRENAQE